MKCLIPSPFSFLLCITQSTKALSQESQEILLEKPDPRTCLEEGIGTKSKQEIEQSFLILPTKLLSNEYIMIAQMIKNLPAMQKAWV